MAVVNFNKKKFEKEIGKLNQEMLEKISLFGTPVENLNQENIQIEIFPNRPDLLSYHNFKKSFLSFLGKNTGLKKYAVNKEKKDYEVKISKSLSKIRPLTVCAVVKGLRFDDEKIKEIIEMQEKLHATIGRKRKKVAIGIYPLEKIKFPIIFTSLEPDKIKFTPIDEKKEMSGLEILQKNKTGKEYAHLLAGKTKFPVFIDSKKEILSMPPIINSLSTGKITTKTKEIFIECSGFDSKILNSCLNIIVSNFYEMGGKIFRVIIKHRKKEIAPELSSKKIKFSIKNANKLLGLNLNEKEIKKLLEKMGHDYKKDFVEIPCYRTDILHEVDIIEEIAIAYGYDKIIPEMPKIYSIGNQDKKEEIKRRFSEIFIGLSMIEVSNYHLTSKNDQIEKMGLSEKNEKFIEVESSKTEYSILRKNLSHFLLKNFSENTDSEYPQEIFEIGKIFIPDKINEKIIEKEMLSVGISPGNFTRIKQIIEYFFRMIEKTIIFKEPEKTPSHFISERTAEIIFNEKKIGFIGEIHPKILKNWKIKMPVALLEIELKEILNELIKN